MHGFWNKVLRVNLSSGQVQVDSLRELDFRQYLGGSALGTKILYDEVPPGTPGLAIENKLIFAVGPYQGAGVAGSAKWAVVSKSPQTNTFAISTAGAEWGHRFKKAGYDVLIIEGKSAVPVYLTIINDQVELKPAVNLWGKDTIETIRKIKKEMQETALSVLSIGPAGENEVAIACLVTDEHSFAGRCGFGAVMGSKNLKAIAVKGTKEVLAADAKSLRSINKQLFKKLKDKANPLWRKFGTPGFVSGAEEIGDLPVKNWEGDVWPEGAAKIGGKVYNQVLNAKTWPCLACPVGCHRHISLSSPEGRPGLNLEGAGPEYETLGLLGSNCLVDDVVALSLANDLCNRLGIDTISAGAFIAFLMDCYDRGILNKDDLNGLDLEWGNSQALIELVNLIGNKQGIGKMFANGIRQAAVEIGNGAEELTVEVKNLDLPAHDPRTYFSLAVNYATSTRGACHLRGYPHFGESGPDDELGHQEVPKRFGMEGQAELTVIYQNWSTVQDSLCVCMFMYYVGMTANEHLELLKAITGWEMSMEELLLIGERAWNLQRLINIGDGLSRADDRLPKKMFMPAKAGFRKGKFPYDLERYLDEYYLLRGWTKEGIPTENKRKHLAIPSK